MKITNNFYSVLFEANEQTCFSNNIYGTLLQNNTNGPYCDTAQFFSINPMHTSRADSNVTNYRNILIEFDTLSPEEQLAQLTTVPYSTLTWSGGKSYHAILSLDSSCVDISAYKYLVRRIQSKLPDMDRSTGNPSRFSRMPNAIRDNGNEQTLVEVRSRVSTSEFQRFVRRFVGSSP